MNKLERRIFADLLDELANALEHAATKLRAAPSPMNTKERPAVAKPPPDWVDTKELASWLHLSPQTFRKWRLTGGGPPYAKFGNRVLYKRKDVESWLAERTFKHTADESARRIQR
jgi:hypothetical protein